MGIAILLMGGLGLAVGIGLAIASKIFYVYVDPKILAVEAALPGANCGGCGYPGCSSNAEAVVAGKAAPNSCVAAGPEVAEAIAAILGVSVEAKEPDIARPGCTYGVADADTKFLYDGLNDCRAAALLNGGMKVCTIGCLGLGTCARACPFDAITMGPEGLPVVDEVRCTGCGTCERVCPKNIITLSSVTRRILKEYTTEECTTPCQRACPAGINICGYIGAVAEGDHDRAVQIIKERNPFPTVIGRICPRPCENECRRQYVDEPVAINFLKRCAADHEMEGGRHIQPYKAPDTGRRVAVIGGGVQGMSAAFFAARLGHDTTVYEAGEQLGGLLRSAIARQRLPMSVLDWDIEGILDMGVKTHTGRQLGDDPTIPDLLAEGYQAVLLAVGGWDSRLTRTQGRGEASPAPGCRLLIDVAKAGDGAGYPPIQLDGHIVIVGNAHLQPALIERCKALGASRITLISREADLSAIDPEQVDIRINVGLSKLTGRGDNLEAVELTDLDSGTRETIDARHVVFAAGRIPELIYTPVPDTADATASTEPVDGGGAIAWEAFPPYKQPAFHHEIGVMAPGDALTDFSAAIKAIAAGRRAAASIHRRLYDMPLDLPEHVVAPDTPVQNVHSVEHVPVRLRRIMPLADADQMARGAELEQGYTPEMAKAEADRCLQCGLICYLREKSPAPQQIAAGQ
ncbi:(Fe-S)-binding protein [Desulfatitalea alkaliphila]|uniref:Ion-translocating oxidoreductase complex subunit B n=1 Tax=Desulfatitalea alkaliphila TaxID=2929485 RepID=A0AA41R2V4_9BACT|nr:(Fe-S)-binding protein [Desulfatitalea alkaliphila]MCJ8499910.1 FAD-dependent oxidoreductase [Desulfatitalea alkaliphila]